MNRVKHNEVPVDYRRNYKEEAVEALKLIISGMILGAVLMLILFAKLM